MKYIENQSNIVTLKSLYYFMIAPTLCFQLYYPYRPKIRKIWLLKRIIEFVIIEALQTSTKKINLIILSYNKLN